MVMNEKDCQDISERLNKISEIVVTDALKYSPNGKEDGILRNTMIYLQAKEKNIKSLREYLQEEQVELYIFLVHAMKSTSATLGARELSSEARELENKSKEEGLKSLKEETEKFLMHYISFCESLEKTFQKELEEKRIEQEQEQILTMVSDNQFRVILKQLMAQVDSFDYMEASESLKKLMTMRTMKSDYQLEKQKLYELLEDFEYEEVSEKVKELISGDF